VLNANLKSTYVMLLVNNLYFFFSSNHISNEYYLSLRTLTLLMSVRLSVVL